jgi:hypothetical protein
MADDTVKVDLIINALGEGFSVVANKMEKMEASGKKLTEMQKAMAYTSSISQQKFASQVSIADKLKAGLKSVSTAAMGVTLGIAAINKVVGKTDEFLIMAQTMERAELALIGYTKSADVARIATEAVAQASGGVLSKLEAARTATRFFSMGLADNAAQAARLTQIAITLGATVGTGPHKAINDFTLLLTNQAYRRLDTFGIGAATVRRRVNELSAATKDLTREEAFLIAVMEQGGKQLDELAASGFTAASGLDKFKAHIEDIKLSVGEWLAEGLNPWLEGLTDLSVAVELARDKIILSSDSVYDYQKRVAEIGLTTDIWTKKTYETRKAEAALREETRALASATLEGAEANERLDDLLGDVAISAKVAEKPVSDFARSLQNLVDAAEKGIKDPFDEISFDAGQRAKDALEGLEYMEAGGGQLSLITDRISEAFGQAKISPEQARGFYEEVYVEAQGIEVAIGNLDFREATINIRDALNVPFAEAYQLLKDVQEGTDLITMEEVIIATRNWRGELEKPRDIVRKTIEMLEGQDGAIYRTRWIIGVTGAGGTGPFGGEAEHVSAPSISEGPARYSLPGGGWEGQHGLDFMVPPSHTGDTFGPIWARGRERVLIQTPDQAASGTGGSITIGNLNLYGVQKPGELFEAIEKEAAHRGMQFSRTI